VNKLLVVGAGYLGSEIVNVLSDQYEVIPTTRSGLNDSVKINVLDPETFSNIPSGIEHVVYCVSADSGNDASYRNAYLIGVKNLLSYFKNKSLRTFIFISSTGVYAEDTGALVDESSSLVGGESRSRFIVEGEREVLSFEKNVGVVCRLSGIYGPGREHFLKNALAYPLGVYNEIPSYTNRIHKVDGARAVKFLLEKNLQGTWNISDQYPYEKLEAMNIIRQVNDLGSIAGGAKYLEAMENGTALGKRVSSEKLVNVGFKFLYPSLREGYGRAISSS
jgi:nucleoside-diphosphate-sugar epimerase